MVILNYLVPGYSRLTHHALYHEVAEAVTGDPPAPLKRLDDDLRHNIKTLEHKVEQRVLSTTDQVVLNKHETALFKCADYLEALITILQATKNPEHHVAKNLIRYVGEAVEKLPADGILKHKVVTLLHDIMEGAFDPDERGPYAAR